MNKDTSNIPKGVYCYDDNNTCPYWSSKPDEYPYREDGYCSFLGKSDWEMNEESDLVIVLAKDKTIEGKTLNEVFEYGIDEKTQKKIHFTSSLLWDKVKECNINMGEYNV